MLAALDAAQAAGGDIRGQQSAAILIVKATSSGRAWADRTFDLRVEDHPDPLAELRRLVVLNRAYARTNRGDELVAENRFDEATIEYQAAAKMAPEIMELPYWQAVTLASIGRVDEALPIFKRVFEREPAWATLTPRLVPSRLLPDDPALLQRILSEAPAGAAPAKSTPSSKRP
jgi:tetratricopeptide (TPR) repeat protein